MRGKHSNPLVHIGATFSRELLRRRLAKLVSWDRLDNPEPGCTAIIGACSMLPDILIANLRCLQECGWDDLKRTVVVADCVERAFPATIEKRAHSLFPKLRVEFLYYNQAQAATAEALKLPFVYSWLSWCLALKQVKTRHVLFHDYDALPLGPALAHRYRRFVQSHAVVQGISWYRSNGIEAQDRLATTFEAFMDATWLRAFAPIMLFNKLRILDGRSIDFDTTLDIQHRFLTPEQRTVAPMNLDELVHPSQMIHQYTMFRRAPGAPLPCFSIPMIPLYLYLGGRVDALEHASRVLEAGPRDELDLLNDKTRENLTQLNVAQVDWVLKQFVAACVCLAVPPERKVYRYGRALYELIDTPAPLVWEGDFTTQQRAWIKAAAA